jgi:AcrR family transcriptional regulator
MSEKTNKQTRLSGEARRELIVQSALELAAKRGIDRVTTQDMAEAMGLTQGAIFRHFATKDDIWLAVVDWIRGQVAQNVGRIADDDSLAALEKLFLAQTGFIAKYPAIPRLMFTDLIHSDNTAIKQTIQGIVTGFEEKVAGLLRQAKERGAVAPDLDEYGAATLFLGMIQGLAVQAAMFGAKRAIAGQAKKVFPLYLNGILRRPSQN